MKTAQAQTIEQNQMQEATKIAPNVNVISGIIGDDILVGIPQIDVIDGDAGRDILLGSSGNDALSGGPGGDFIYGGAGGDVLDGDNGEDILFGGDDIDAIGGGSGGDAVNGGSGSDALSGNQGNDALHGSNGNDAIYGNEGEDVLFGDKGNDVLNGGGGSDILNGGDDGDTLYGNTGNDFLNGDNSNDILFGGSVNDVLYASQGRDTLSGSAGVDVFVLLKGGERDIIKDFVVADDTILISAADFGSGLTPGAPLESNQFVIGATANDASDRFIYDATNGALFFDMDGIGKTGQQQIATLHKPCKIPLKKKRSPNCNQGKTMSKENLARVMEQMQLDPSLQQKQVAATNADVLNSTKFGGLEDRQIKSSSYSLGKLIEWKRIEDTMKSIARRTTLALFGWALVIGAAMPTSAGSPDVKNYSSSTV